MNYQDGILILLHAEIVKLVLERLWQRSVIVVGVEDVSRHSETLASVQHSFLEQFLYFRWKKFPEDPEANYPLHVVDQLGLTHQLVPLGSLGQLLDVVDGNRNKEVHHDDANEDDESEDREVGETGKVVVVDLIVGVIDLAPGIILFHYVLSFRIH